ncbi:MAG: penicillin-binding protein [Bacteroidetes bacterium]|nr:MAG: penicillin-binding protein [Bacteroidota bacterium]
MRKLIALLFAFSTFSGIAQKSKPVNSFAGFDTAFARILKDWHAAGFAVAVVDRNKVIYAKGFGYRNIEERKPVTPNTLFAIGSCTKAFTASILGMLRQEGKVDFDKPVRSFLPELKFYNDEMNNQITLRDMMSHRTGLPRHDYSWYYFSTKSRDSLIQRIRYLEPTAEIRQKWQYNNFMFMALGAVAERLTGRSWEENVRERIFLPLNMNHSVFTIQDMIRSDDAAVGYELFKDSIIKRTDYYYIDDAMSPAGAINSNVNDMSSWLITWINGGRFNGKEIIPAAFVSEALSSQMVVAGGFPTTENKDLYFANYGLGWFLSSYRGHYRVEHGGNIDGFSADASFFPSDSLGIIVLVNQNNSVVPSIVRNMIADKLLELSPKDWNSYLKNSVAKAKSAEKDREKSEFSNKKQNTAPSHPLKDYTGLYDNKGYGTIEIALLNDSLFAIFGKHKMWLRHYHYDWFQPFENDAKDGIDTSDKNEPIQFLTGMAGNIESATIVFASGLQPINFIRIPMSKEMSKDSLRKFVGNYELSGIEMKVYTRNENTLYLFVPGQPEYELVPIDKNKFSIKSLTGFTIQFNQNDKNEVTELLSIQPNGTFKATRKK